MKMLQTFLFVGLSVALFSCKPKIDLECGCTEEGGSRSQYLVRAYGQDIQETILIFETLTDRDRGRGIYDYNVDGVCLEGERQVIIFCADSSSDYRSLRDEFPNVRIDDQEY